MNIFRKAADRIISPEHLLKPEARLGSLPSARELYGSFLRVAWPAVLESAVVSLTGLVDTMMVGSMGPAAISAVGITGQPRLLVFAFFFSLNAGVVAVVSRKKGEGDREGANRAMHTALSVCVVMAALLFAVAFSYARPLLRFAGAKSDIIDNAVLYFRITVAGVCVNSFGMCVNAAQRACSRTRISMRTSLIANIVNIVFNYFLINGKLFFPRLGIEGAAIATLIGNVCACAVSIASVIGKNGYLKLSFATLFRPSGKFLSMISRVSVGAAGEQLFVRVGMFMFSKVVAELGTNEFATHQICMTLISISFSIGDGLGIAASALVGQNLGKRRSDLSELYAKGARLVGLAISAVTFTLFMFGGSWLVSLFTDEADIIRTGGIIMMIVACVTPAQIAQTLYTGCLRGAGDTKYTAVVSFASICMVRPVIAYLLCYPLGLGVIGAWVALFIDQITRFVCSTARFAGGKWKNIRL